MGFIACFKADTYMIVEKGKHFSRDTTRGPWSLPLWLTPNVRVRLVNFALMLLDTKFETNATNAPKRSQALEGEIHLTC